MTYRAQVRDVLRVVSLRSSTRYAWLGSASRALAPAVLARLSEEERRAQLVSSLREELYASFYSQGRAGPALRAAPMPTGPDPALQSALSEANTGSGSWEPGWSVERADADEPLVSRAGLRMRVARGDLRGAGAIVSRRLANELPGVSPGFYTAVGDAPLERAPELRVYWNADAAGAPSLVHALTARLNGSAVPFRLKIVDHPARFGRCDAAVLYLAGDAFVAMRRELLDVAAGARLRPPTPVFTLPLARGLAAAEDTADGDSFGMHRCGLLAEAIVRGAGARGLAARLEAVAATFAEHGVDLDAPYLELTRRPHVL